MCLLIFWLGVLGSSSAVASESHFGPRRNDPTVGIPKHAYSPSEEISKRDQPGQKPITVPGQLLIKLSSDTTPALSASATAAPSTKSVKGVLSLTTNSQLNAVLARHGIKGMTPVFRNARTPAKNARLMTAQGAIIPAPDLTKWQRATVDTGASVEEIVNRLKNEPGIEQAEPDYIRKPTGPLTTNDWTSVAATATQTASLALSSFTDPEFGDQWHLSAAKVPEAWQWLSNNGYNPGGSRDVIVAVIDTGVDYNHPDLAANMWTNGLEVPGDNIDNDNNGFIDDVHGVTVTGSTWDHNGNPQDDHGHGTHVAGIIAARANNGLGGVGIAYNVQIMAIKAAQYSGVLAASDIAEAILYATTNGADVINMSFGGYGRSQAEEDALAVAFGQSVLVAAAGNNGKPNDRACDPLNWGALYPASYNWVLGVMAQAPTPDTKGDYLAGFSNWDCIPRDTVEYELMAPGVDIISTLPGGAYAAWDGTSMAAPIASGIAALVRTRFPDKSIHSSRFIMGQVASTGSLLQGRTPERLDPISYPSVNAFNALTNVPKPSLSYLEHWLFDTTTQAAGNNNNGRVDSGETVDLAISIQNRWGNANNAIVRLEAQADGAMGPDPCVTFVTDTVNYGAVGAFATDDNGLITDAQGAVTGVANPFRFTVSATCPNDHVIPFKLTMTARNGLDPADATEYSTTSRYYMVVQRGTELPRVISNNMTLSKDRLWIVPSATLVENGATLTITEGTQVQFFNPDPANPYAVVPKPEIQVEGSLIVNGTATEPVELFPNSLYPSRPVKIYTGMSSGGRVDLRYAKVINPNISGSIIEHSEFTQNLNRIASYSEGLQPPVWSNCCSAPSVSASGGGQYNRLVWLGHESGGLSHSGFYDTNLFDSCYASFNSGPSSFLVNTVFLRNNKKYSDWDPDRIGASSFGTGSVHPPSVLRLAFPYTDQNKTYTMVSKPEYGGINNKAYLDFSERFAQTLGGHVVAINNSAENSLLSNYMQTQSESTFNTTYPSFNCGSSSYGGPPTCYSLFQSYGSFTLGLIRSNGQDYWLSGEPMSYSGWGSSPGNGEYSYSFYTTWWRTSWLSNPTILELPGSLSQTDLDEARQDFLDQKPFSTASNNAFLNDWNDLNLYHWMRFSASGGRESVNYLSNNFWGTSSTTLIDAAITDFHDDFNRGLMDYRPILTTAPATAYPFMVNAVIRNGSGSVVSKVGSEIITLTVTFNRNMDTSLQPEVSFGPAEPYTDYKVPPIGNGWTDARTWKGQFTITPVTGDGIQSIRVAGAVAADDPWLVTGNDFGRFRFEIITSGTEAMTLQASGRLGGVDLSWTQDDFDLLAGYHIYRSESENGTYARINSTLVPSGQNTYVDTQGAPGVTAYYKFTVVKTDLSESGFSNVASAAPLDNIPPVISHTPISTATPGVGISIFAEITDNIGVTGSTLYYRKKGTSTWNSRAMVHGLGNRWSASLEGSLVVAPGLEYYIAATDGTNTSYAGGSSNANNITIGTTTTTALSVSSASINQGQSITLTATVSGTSPTGNVSFMDGSTLLGTSPITINKTATLTTTSLAAGTRSLTAIYAGDPSYGSSTSPAVSVSVVPAATFTLTASKTGLGDIVSVLPAGLNCGMTCSASFKNGEMVTLNAVPQKGNTFMGWSGACQIYGREKECRILLTQNMSVSAKFMNTYILIQPAIQLLLE